jgi:hypothetical protein
VKSLIVVATRTNAPYGLDERIIQTAAGYTLQTDLASQDRATTEAAPEWTRGRTMDAYDFEMVVRNGGWVRV